MPADDYDAFMGRFSRLLGPPLLARAGLAAGDRVVDVGCGPGTLTRDLVSLLGEPAVAAVDPSGPFVDAVRERLPGVDVRRAAAEALPFDDDAFDAALAQLCVHFMQDPVAGLREMARVTRPGGQVLATVWDHPSGRGPLTYFWEAVYALTGESPRSTAGRGQGEGELAALAERAGLVGVEPFEITVTEHFGDFAEWWAPYTRPVGPVGERLASLGEEGRAWIRDRCHERLGETPEVTVTAWAVRALVA